MTYIINDIWMDTSNTRKKVACIKNGPSIGRGNSLQAKGNRMLLATLFASIIAEDYSSEDCNIKYISDNAALI